ncbi:chromo domain-containing protein [Sulfurimonas sp.]
MRRKTLKGKKLALVKWKGYSDKFNEWIPAEDLRNI